MQTIAPSKEIHADPTTERSVPTGRRLDYIDAVRGIAACMVMLEHYCERWFPAVTDPITNYLNLGRVGVITFFIVSGFVIPMSIERKSDQREFWISRFCRLYPAYWAALILFVLVSYASAHFGYPDKWLEMKSLGPRVWIPNAFIAQMFFRVKDIIPVAWTLGLEWIIYISASVLKARGWLTKTQALFFVTAGLCLVAGVAVPLLAHHRVPYAAVAALTSAAAGLALYRLWQGELSKMGAAKIVATFIVLLLLGSWINYGLYPATTESNLVITPVSEITSTFLGFAVFLVPMMLRNRHYPSLLLWLGRISYSIYIVHDVVPIPKFLTGVGGFLYQIAETLLISYLCYRFIEQPGIVLGKRLISRLRSSAPASAAA